MRHLPMGTVTLLFTDIEGSTRLLEQVGERYPHVLEECRHLLRAAFQAYHGHEVDTQGDSFFVAFARATDAVSAAVDAQRTLATHVWPKDVAVRVRMGLHTGEPELASEGYVGLDVHHAARIMSAGYGGQVLLSQTTRELVEHALPEGVQLRDLGSTGSRIYSGPATSSSWSSQACLPTSHRSRPSMRTPTTCPSSPPHSLVANERWPASASSCEEWNIVAGATCQEKDHATQLEPAPLQRR